MLGALQSLAGYRRLGAPLQNASALDSVAFGPDGRTLVAAGDDGTIIWWDSSARRRLRPPVAAHRGAVGALAFSPDGRRLASGGADGAVRLWNAATGRLIGRPLHFQSRFVVDDLAFSPDGATLAAGGSGGPLFFAGDGPRSRVRLWDARTGRPLGAPLLARTRATPAVVSDSERVNAIAFSRTAATSPPLQRSTVRIFELPGRRVTARLPVPGGGLTSRSRSAPTAVAGRRRHRRLVRVWDVRGGRLRDRPLGGPRDHELRRVQPRRAHAGGGSRDGSVRLWTVEVIARSRCCSGPPIGRRAPRPTCPARRDRRGVQSARRALASVDGSGAVQLWAVRPRPRSAG